MRGGLGAMISRLRKARGYTQAEVATAVGVSSVSVWSWEAGKSAPAFGRLEKLAAALEVPLAELLGASPVSGAERRKKASAHTDTELAPCLENLAALVRLCRTEIAEVARLPPEKVRIMVEF